MRELGDQAKEALKNEIRTFNGMRIQTLMTEMLAYLDRTDIKRVKSKKFPVQIKDRDGDLVECVAFLTFSHASLQKTPQATFSIDIMSSPRTHVCQHNCTFDFQNARIDPEYGRIVTSTTTTAVDFFYRGVGLGTPISRGGEEVRLSIAKKIAALGRMDTIQSIIEDASDPKEWTTRRAHEFGYTEIPPINTYRDESGHDFTYPTFTRFDRVSFVKHTKYE